MRAKSRVLGLLCACAAALAVVWPADASAQPGFYHGRSRVFISAGYSYWPAAGPYYWGWYPYPYPLGWYPPPYYYYDPYAGWASARVQVTPKDAQVFVDGYFVGTVDDFDGFSQRLHIEPGEHEIELYRQGYRTIREKLLFRPDQSYRIKYVMEPLAAGEPNEPRPQPAPGASRQPAGRPPSYPRPPRQGYPPPPPPQPENPPAGEQRGDMSSTFGTLSIRVQPVDAIITVDGERWDGPEGGSRLVLQVPEGTHRVEIRKDGFKDYSRTVEVRRGEVTTINVSLASEQQP